MIPTEVSKAALKSGLLGAPVRAFVEPFFMQLDASIEAPPCLNSDGRVAGLQAAGLA